MLSVSACWQRWVHEPWLIDRKFERALRQLKGHASGQLLDVGCGRKPFAALYAGAVSRHVGVDLPGASLVPWDSLRLRADVAGDAQALPFRSAAFDTLLSTHMLVHVPEPAQAVSEMSRVLKPGGHLILSARQMWHVYTPRDYYRFTASGLRHLAQQQGLEVVTIVPVGGFVGRIGIKLTYRLQRLNRRKIRWITAIPVGLLVLVTQTVFYVLDALLPTPDDVVFNILVARKR